MEAFAKGKFTEALAVFAKAAKDVPGAGAFSNLATVNLKLECFRAAIKHCDQAIALDPHALRAHVIKGKAYAAMGKAKKAVAAWKDGVLQSGGRGDVRLLCELHALLAGGGKPPKDDTPASGASSAGDDARSSVCPAAVAVSAKAAAATAAAGGPASSSTEAVRRLCKVCIHIRRTPIAYA